MADLDKPIVNSSIKPNKANDYPYEPNAKSIIWWSLGGLATFAMIGGFIYDVGDGTRTTASPGSMAAPAGSSFSRPGR